jgi:PAS domain S-box-containing protein
MRPALQGLFAENDLCNTAGIVLTPHTLFRPRHDIDSAGFLAHPGASLAQVSAEGAPTIRRALVWLAVACVLPIALAAASLIYYVYSSERAALTGNSLDRTRAIAIAVDHELASARDASPARMATLLAAQKLPPDWRAAIIDNRALVVARTHDSRTFAGKPVRPDLRNRMLHSADGAYETLTLDGVPVLTVYSRAPVSQWSVAVGIPLAELTASLYRGIAWLALCTAAAAGAGLLLALFIARRIAASLTALTGPAAAVGSAGPLLLPPLHFAEARMLGAALADAHTALAAMRDGLRASEQRLDLATQATGIGIWVRDLKKKTIWASQAWRNLFGFGPDDNIAMDDVMARIHPDDRAAVHATLLGVARPGGSYDLEYRLQMADGSLRWVVSRGCIAGDNDTVLGVSSNVSPRKLAELALQKKQQQVIHLARVGVLGELSGALAHEINQPLTSILSNAQAAQRLVERTPPPLDDIRDILTDIVAEDQRAAEVIRRLRGLLKNSATAHEAIDFGAVTAEVVGLLRNDLLNRDIRVDTAIAPGLPAVTGDHVQLQQVLINLIVNGCDAIGPRHAGSTAARTITVTASAADGQRGVDLTVHDSGPGLAADPVDSVFEPFYTSKPDGMGLGLPICRKIVAAHGGAIQAANHAAGGAVFHIFLPGAHD